VLGGFIAFSFGLDALLPAGFLNGSGGYLPPLLALFVVATLTRGTPTGRILLLSAAIFSLSLVFRTLGNALCTSFPLGTHFLWHMLNATVLYLLLRAAMTADRPPS
jgi:hypothetical protein